MENRNYTNGFEKGYIKGFQKGRDSVVDALSHVFTPPITVNKEKVNTFNETEAVLRIVLEDIGSERSRLLFKNVPGRQDYELGLDKARDIIEKHLK